MIRGMMLMGSNVAVMAAMMAQPTASAIFKNTIDPQVLLSADRQQAVISGPIGCDEEVEITIQVVITQPASGGSAEGETEILCTGNEQQWSITALSRKSAVPMEGPAAACATAIIHEDGDVVGRRHWCARKGVTLLHPG